MKNVSEKLYTRKIKKKKRSRDVKIGFVSRKTPKPQDAQNHNSLY